MENEDEKGQDLSHKLLLLKKHALIELIRKKKKKLTKVKKKDAQ